MGVNLNFSDANYDVVFNETLVDCVDSNFDAYGKGACFDSIYDRDRFCREMHQKQQASCEAVKQCLLNRDYAELTNPCEESCTKTKHNKTLQSCRIQFEAVQRLSHICVPRSEPHDQHVDWRVLQTMDYVREMAGRCGWKPKPLPEIMKKK